MKPESVPGDRPQSEKQQVNSFTPGPSTDDEVPSIKPVHPDSFISKVLGSITYKIQPSGSVLYMVRDQPAFVDHGQHILMNSKTNEDEAILAAILLAKEKYGGSFELTGSEAFKRHAVEIILKHKVDVKLTNPQQDMLRRELVKSDDETPPQNNGTVSTKTTIGKPAQDELRARDAINGTESAELVSDINPKELAMKTTQNDDVAQKPEEPKLILRGVKKLNTGEFDTTVLLFQGKGDYLQGFVKVGDQKHQVLAYLNKRHPDQETGEIKPNFIKLCEPHGTGDDTKWREIGYGNAINHRKDDKPVYFDEVLLSVGSEILKARITRHVDEELHRKLGFQEKPLTRPKDDNKSATSEAIPHTKKQEETAKATYHKSRARG